jgi:hypothetical protein
MWSPPSFASKPIGGRPLFDRESLWGLEAGVLRQFGLLEAQSLFSLFRRNRADYFSGCSIS